MMLAHGNEMALCVGTAVWGPKKGGEGRGGACLNYASPYKSLLYRQPSSFWALLLCTRPACNEGTCTHERFSTSFMDMHYTVKLCLFLLSAYNHH